MEHKMLYLATYKKYNVVIVVNLFLKLSSVDWETRNGVT